MMVASGVDLKTVQTRFGQSDPRLTLGGYADALDERDRDAADLLGSQGHCCSVTAARVKSLLHGPRDIRAMVRREVSGSAS
jgi:hypothetical protein